MNDVHRRSPAHVAVAMSVLQCSAAAWLGGALTVVLFADRIPEPGVVIVTATVVGVLAGLANWLVGTEDDDVVTPLVVSSPMAATPSARSSHASREPSPPTSAIPTLRSWGAYLGERAGLQCPTCGGFRVGHDAAGARCGTCGTTWSVRANAPLPDVIVRSWLHSDQED